MDHDVNFGIQLSVYISIFLCNSKKYIYNLETRAKFQKKKSPSNLFAFESSRLGHCYRHTDSK